MKKEHLRALSSPMPQRAFRWRQFKKHKPAFISLYVLVFLLLLALLAPLIANQQPLYVKYKGYTFFPAFSLQNNYDILDPNTHRLEHLQLDVTDWKHLPCEQVLFAPIPYSAGVKDYDNANYKSPFDAQYFNAGADNNIPIPIHFRHWLGTNKTGEDVLAGIIHGAKISLSVGIFAMLIASLIGIFLGSIAGYFGDSSLKTSLGLLIVLPGAVFMAYFYAIQNRLFILEDAMATSTFSFCWQAFQSIIIFIFVWYVFHLLGKLVGKLPGLKKSISIPLDSIINKAIELLISLPNILLIITIAAISQRSLVNVAIIIGLTSWTLIARQIRSELLKIRELEYVAAARSMGFSAFHILFFHALPNAIAPALVTIAFGVAGSIIIESGLSFLNIGVPLDTVSWGRLLAEGREQFSAWWLVIFPGCAIFVTVTIYNLIGEGIQEALDPKNVRP